MDADRYVRHAQEALLNYFRDFKTIEVRVSYLCENMLQGPANALGHSPAKRGGPHFGGNEVVPTIASNPLIQASVRKSRKQVPSSLVGLAF